MRKLLSVVAVLLSGLVLASCSGSGVDVDTSGFGNNTDGIQPSNEIQSSIGEDFSIENLISRGELTEMQRVTIYDSALGCEAIRSIVTAGWQASGGAFWTWQSGGWPATIDFFAYSPDAKARSGYISPMNYSDPDPQEGLSEGQYDNGSLPAPVKHVMTPEAYLQEYLTNYFAASSSELIDVRYPEGDHAMLIQELEQQGQALADAQAAEFNATSMNMRSDVQTSIRWAEIEMRFVLDGITYKLCANCDLATNSQTITIQDNYTNASFTNTHWYVGQIRYYSCEESVFDDPRYMMPSIEFQNNLIMNQQWYDSVRETAARIWRENEEKKIKDFQQISAQIQQQAQQAAAQSQQNYSYYSPANSSSDSGSGYDTNASGGWTNVLTEQSYYEAPDGGHVLLDYNDYHYTDGSSIYSSSTPLNTGGTSLSPLTDLGTMGGD